MEHDGLDKASIGVSNVGGRIELLQDDPRLLLHHRAGVHIDQCADLGEGVQVLKLLIQLHFVLVVVYLKLEYSLNIACYSLL